MQRYFCDRYENDQFLLSKEDTYHITKVMRSKIGDEMEVVYHHKLYIAKITTLLPTVTATIQKEFATNQSKLFVSIAQSLVKEQKMDYILQKGTELGAHMFIPLEASRSVVKLDDKEGKKIERWQTIVKEASEQSKRLDVPMVTKIHNMIELTKLDYDYKILCSVNEMSTSIKTVLSNIEESDRILFVIGPEGGFSSEEEKLLIDNGFISVSLGDRVLRTETASTFLLSIMNYIFMR